MFGIGVPELLLIVVVIAAIVAGLVIARR